MNKLWCALLLCGCGLAAHAETVLVNGSFETNNVGSGYRYAESGVAASGWTFSGGAGVSANHTAWSGYTGAGNYFAFLQNSATVKQQIQVTSLTELAVSFAMSQRSAWNQGGAQTVAMMLDGIILGIYTPYADGGWDSWQNYSAVASKVAAGQHWLSFVGLNPYHAADTAVFLDQVSLAVTPVPEPEIYMSLLVGLCGLGWVRRQRQATGGGVSQ